MCVYDWQRLFLMVAYLCGTNESYKYIKSRYNYKGYAHMASSAKI